MRPPRLLLLLLCFIAFPIFLTFLSLLSATHTRDASSLASGYGTRSSRLRALFSFHTPASLFPPSAIISLTDDNSTFFLARPAAFGPVLPSHGLSSQLWVGSGFGDDNLRKIGSALGAEGELGCSDVPGWGEGDKKHNDEEPSKKKKNMKTSAASKPDKEAINAKASSRKKKRTGDEDSVEDDVSNSFETNTPSENDGTDDHLHHPLPESNPAEPAEPGQPAEHEPTNDKSKTQTHADIQSLQESAEIAGKVVLLSRGGCGFLEKVKWVQRRGGVALIVGDDARGGPLITMYARGDTSNVTIPALFTSHTTAHLLSSLIPPETADDQNNDGGKEAKSKKPTQKTKQEDDGPTFTAKSATNPTARPGVLSMGAKVDSSKDANELITRSWFERMLSFFGMNGGAHYPWHVAEDSRRPPSSGSIDWVLLEDWDERASSTKTTKVPLAKPTMSAKSEKVSSISKKPKSSSKSGDDFVIGIQDWRDPDVLVPTDKQDTTKIAHEDPAAGKDGPRLTSSNKQPTNKPEDAEALKGGSITPGSGEYGHESTGRDGKSGSSIAKHVSSEHTSNDGHRSGHQNSWFSRFLWSKSSDRGAAEPLKEGTDRTKPSGKTSAASSSSQKKDSDSQGATEEHEGLWVTLTPATMSTSPFFDTLLVLVVSPLVTLTVVYALLLLRSRIRRRRWRAPKSVVDRLPVRVYHTMSSSSSTTSSQIGTPATSSPTSPLLRSTSRTIPSRSRPRSQTTSGVIPSLESASDSSSAASSPAKEKQANAPVWRKRYTGRQIECVVCLEEYVDGQSRVMRLPCGHEFHADCM
jgi:RING-like zinc finger/PA domain